MEASFKKTSKELKSFVSAKNVGIYKTFEKQ